MSLPSQMAFLENYLEEFVQKGETLRLAGRYESDHAKCLDALLDGLLPLSQAVLDLEDYEMSEIWALVPRGWDILRAVYVLHESHQQQEAAILLRTFWEHMVITCYVAGAGLAVDLSRDGGPDVSAANARPVALLSRQHLTLYKLNSLGEMSAFLNELETKMEVECGPPPDYAASAGSVLSLFRRLFRDLQSDLRHKLRSEPWDRFIDEGLDTEFEPDRWIDSSVRYSFWQDATAWALKIVREAEIDALLGKHTTLKTDVDSKLIPSKAADMFESFLRKTGDRPHGFRYGYTSALLHSLYVLPWNERIRIDSYTGLAHLFYALLALSLMRSLLPAIGVEEDEVHSGMLRVFESIRCSPFRSEIPWELNFD